MIDRQNWENRTGFMNACNVSNPTESTKDCKATVASRRTEGPGKAFRTKELEGIKDSEVMDGLCIIIGPKEHSHQCGRHQKHSCSRPALSKSLWAKAPAGGSCSGQGDKIPPRRREMLRRV